MVSAADLEERTGFLRSCFVEGDPAQEKRVRRRKQRALLFSIAFQILIVAALVLFPLLSRGERITVRGDFTPVPPYNRGGNSNHRASAPRPPHGKPQTCRFCAPPAIPPTIVMQDHDPIGDPGAPAGPEIPGLPEGPTVPGGLTAPDSRSGPTPPPASTERIRISSRVEAAMLIHRVEPIYPRLAIQTRREGSVELHAVISTEGSIQSLEVLSGEPLLIQSALAAVREWRYRPTILDGQPVEVDTHITVVYTLSH
jgi:periplasmic protein TonB